MVEVGNDAPDFSLCDQDNNIVTCSEHHGKRIVLAFFPAAFTGICTTEMCTFQNNLSKLNAVNAAVFGICSDSRFANKAFADQNGITFPILSDYSRKTIEDYEIALYDFAGMPGYTASERAVFIIDEDGKIMWKWVGENPGKQPDYDTVLSKLGV
ncbi:MAG: redoxin domain-containing protein [Candidatus Thalassarchaeaceae archaeon]|mgnify:CR=1 FL=1|jgi:peroxiredoxin|nr:redoxin domain-containing protein [Candidatus Thalassarchaeaceae archaeon]